MKTKKIFSAIIGVIAIVTVSKSQVTNHSFENWRVVPGLVNYYEEPGAWGTTNINEDARGLNTSIIKTEDRVVGTYAMKLTSSPLQIVEAMAGANPALYNAGDGFSYNLRPEKLQFYHKFSLSGNDTAYVSVLFTKNNGAEVVAAGEVKIYTSLNRYSLIELPIHYNTTNNPDVATIRITMGNRTNASINRGGSELYVDNFEFVGFPTGTNDIYFTQNLGVYPNPSVDGKFKIEADGAFASLDAILYICDIAGKIIYQNKFTGVHEVELKENTKGVYFYKLISAERVVSNGKLVLQ